MQRDFLSLLPQELNTRVLSYLDARDLCHVEEVCRAWSQIVDANGPYLWGRLCAVNGWDPKVREGMHPCTCMRASFAMYCRSRCLSDVAYLEACALPMRGVECFISLTLPQARPHMTRAVPCFPAWWPQPGEGLLQIQEPHREELVRWRLRVSPCARLHNAQGAYRERDKSLLFLVAARHGAAEASVWSFP